LGDPPLFLGFLKGIDFFWAMRVLWPQALFGSGVLLAIFFLVDSYFDRREEKPPTAGTAAMKLRVSGQVNIGLIGIAILAIVASGFWRPGIGFHGTERQTTRSISGRPASSRPFSTMRRHIFVFFQLAGGDPAALMGPLAKTLTAISLGAAFMGANTYIGNAPNFMVYAIARRTGVNMPGFFPYMIWSGAILFPVFAAVTWLFLM
jgi:Na+/H+ antiporter NhaD/arsenite permease-like protein